MIEQDEGLALLNAIRRWIAAGWAQPITDRMLEDWKRGRGMHSAATMNNARLRRLWMQEARDLVEWEKLKACL